MISILLIILSSCGLKGPLYSYPKTIRGENNYRISFL
ncbi:MAG: lipoprotein [Arsenophonus sp.]